MVYERLAPGVQDSQKADLSAEVFRIRCDGEQRLCSSPKEEIVNYPLILQGEWCEALG